MKKLLALSALACAVCATSASAATLTLNMSGGGTQTFEFSGVLTLDNGNVTVANVSPNGSSSSSGGTVSSSSSSSSVSSSVSSVSSSASSVSSSVSSVGNCTVPNGTQLVSPPFSWFQYTGSMMFDLLGNGTVASFPVTTGSRTGASGGMNAGPQSWTSHVTREFWISSCPGGAPVSNYCFRRGSGAQSISWIQGSARGRCELDTNTQYYVNLRNVYNPTNPTFNCIINRDTPDCAAYIQHRPSGSVD